MLSGDVNKPVGKSGQRKKNTEGKKADARKRKSVQPQEPQQDQVQDIPEAASASLASAEDASIGTSLTDGSSADSLPIVTLEETAPSEETAAVVTVEAAPTALAEAVPVPSDETVLDPPAEAVPVSYQAIANAYCNYTLQSFDQTRSFFGKLAAVRSPDKAFELQTEFAKQACDAFVTESQKISELHSKLAAQRLKRWEDFIARVISPSRYLTRQA